MARCKHCGNFSYLLRVNEDGLCPNCAERDRIIRLSIAEDGCRMDKDFEKLGSALGKIISTMDSDNGLAPDSINAAFSAYSAAVKADTTLCNMFKTASTENLQKQHQIKKDLLSEAAVMINALLDKLHDQSEPEAPMDAQKLHPADEILKYKKLLDVGAITQEEYDAKKSQLLSL